METENEFESPTEHPEETNIKSHQLFPVSTTSYTMLYIVTIYDYMYYVCSFDIDPLSTYFRDIKR